MIVPRRYKCRMNGSCRPCFVSIPRTGSLRVFQCLVTSLLCHSGLFIITFRPTIHNNIGSTALPLRWNQRPDRGPGESTKERLAGLLLIRLRWSLAQQPKPVVQFEAFIPATRRNIPYRPSNASWWSPPSGPVVRRSPGGEAAEV